MTDMQLIVPPLDGNNCRREGQDDDAAAASDNARLENGNREEDQHQQQKGSRSVLPDGLRANFEEMKSVWRAARRAESSNNSSWGDNEKEELKRKERELAVETAVSANAEIAKWENGIAELEALLGEQQDGEEYYDGEEEEQDMPEDEHHQNQHPVVEFPALVSIPVVPVEDDADTDHGSLKEEPAID